MMQLGADGVFVGSGIFKAGNPAQRAAAIVKATTFYDDAPVIADVSRGLGEAMVGINVADLAEPHRLSSVAGNAARTPPHRPSGCSHYRATSASTSPVLGPLGATRRRSRRPEELAEVAGLVIPGGESSVMDKLRRLLRAREPLQGAIAAGLPVYGTCAA